MKLARTARLSAALAAAVLGAALVSGPAEAAPQSASASGRYLVTARSAADYAGLRDSMVRNGAKVVSELPQINTFVISGSTDARSRAQADPRVEAVAADHIATIDSAERPAPNLDAPGLRSARNVALPADSPAAQAGINPDPAFDHPGLQWDFRRIGLPQGWQTTAGRPDVTVGVADTGLDFTHTDLKQNIDRVIDFTATEDPPLCKTFFGTSDKELARKFGGPATTDWNGHGSWIGGNIAAVLNGTGINGIAPKVSLVALKISGWCGSAYDSTILSAFLTAADSQLDVVSISFGGYMDRSGRWFEEMYDL